MSLSFTTRRKQQSLSAKWSSTQQNFAQHLNTDVTAPSTNLFRRHNHQSYCLNQPLIKQKSLVENLHTNKNILTNQTERGYLARGLSVGRSHDIQRSTLFHQVSKKHSLNIAKNFKEKNEQENLRTGDLITRSQKTREQSEILRNSRRVQTGSSTASILKTLDKEIAHLNSVEGKCNYTLKERTDTVDKGKLNKPRTFSESVAGTRKSPSNRKHIQPEVNKVNLSIVLSQALVSSKEDNDFALTDQEVDEEDSADTSSNSGNVIDSFSKTKSDKRNESLPNSLKTTSTLRPTVPSQQKRALYRTSRLATTLSANNNSTAVNSGIHNSQNLNASLSFTIQKRPPLVRAMSAPVRSFDETTKSSTFLNTRRKSRRRKLNNRNISFDKGSCDLLATKDLNFDSKSIINRKVLTRSKSVTPDVVTLVSLISSEGSDSEKEENTLTTNNSHSDSPKRRAPSLRKSGKSVSFQENYPPTFQFSSKEYSHMLRRGSIVSQAQRINSSRPPTAPAGSLYRTTQSNNMPPPDVELVEKKESNLQKLSNKTMVEKSMIDTYDFPEYVRSLKERECWKLFQKMSTKGVHITYDTILRGMLTPTEFRQLQKQREVEEAKTLKEVTDNGLVEETCKKPTTALERLKESLLKN